MVYHCLEFYIVNKCDSSALLFFSVALVITLWGCSSETNLNTVLSEGEEVVKYGHPHSR